MKRFSSADADLFDNNSEAHRHLFFEFICVEKGSGFFLLDETKTEFSAGDICISLPSQVHQLTESTTVEGYIICFNELFLSLGETEFDLFYHKRHFQVFAGHPVIKADDDAVNAMQEIVIKMLHESENNLAFKMEVVRRYLKIFLLYLARQCEHSTLSATLTRPASIVERFLSLLDKQYLQKKMVADYAKELCVTPNYLNDMVKQITGRTAGQHIRQRILMEIKRQAIYTDASMKEIAYSLGFFDPAHFSKYFKKITGINFKDFKTSSQEAFLTQLH